MLYSGSIAGLVPAHARLAAATVLVGLVCGMAWASGASALTINGCEIKAGTRCVGVNLSGANLQRADLRGANLTEANLTQADLSEANLIGANLQRAKAHNAQFVHADLGTAALMGSDLTGSNLYSAKLGRADFTNATVIGVNFVHAHFAETRFRYAKIHNARVIPSDIDGDHWARGYLFARVYTHVNAYGGSGDCTGSSGVTCTGENDDPNARAPFSHGVTLQWGSFGDRNNTFTMWRTGDHGDKLSGRANSNLGDFYVDHVTNGTSFHDLGATQNIAPRGHPGGAIALGVNHHGGFNPGYSINVSGWLPRVTNASGSGP